MTINRREALKLIGISGTVAGITSSTVPGAVSTSSENSVDSWSQTHDQVWLGESFWANPMEDWKIVSGAAECQSAAGDRNVQLLTHQLTEPGAGFETSIQLERIEVLKQDGGAGFKIGIHSEINEYRSNCFAKNGINAGVVDDQLVLAGKRQKFATLKGKNSFRLTLTGTAAKKEISLTLTASDPAGEVLAEMNQSVPAEKLLGNIAIVNNYDLSLKKNQGARYRFKNWEVTGGAFTVDESRKFGPILWNMFSVSDSRRDEGFVLKMSALTGPVGQAGKPTVEFQIEQGGEWKSLEKKSAFNDAWTTIFRIPHWNEQQPTPFRLIYREETLTGTVREAVRAGTIPANPVDRPFRLAALTCQNDYGFPYEPVANNVLTMDPDMVYFSGDQIYENHGGYGLIREPAEPAILNYLRKFYQFGWAFGDVMQDRPTLCIPDDHDVFQGNIWGEGGKKMPEGSTSSEGGYRQPAKMVNVVHTTCVGHHPDAYDPTPCLQDISVYYGDVVYGNISFAVLGDRQWKSGPEHVDTGSGRADHVLDPNFDTSQLDKPGLILLGERQEEFLQHWVEDWRGHTMKVLLSQTVFSGLATHHGGYDGYLKGDLDSGAWPQTARNRTVEILKAGMPLHINGDQHLATLSQYGNKNQRDSCWAFCTPAIAAGYPRWWRPDEVGMTHENRPAHGLPHTGEYLDSFGNKTYVYAVGNPEVGRAANRYEKAHEKGSGFGFVTIDTEQKTYLIEAYRFLIDVTKSDPANQFPGWPVTIQQAENRGENQLR